MFRSIVLCVLMANLLSAQTPPAAKGAPAKGVPAVEAATTITKSRSNVKDNLIAVEPDGRLKCTLPDGKACSEEDLKPVSIPGLKAISKGGQQGFILCETTDGKACSPQQVEAVGAAIRKGYDLKSNKAGRTGVYPREVK